MDNDDTRREPGRNARPGRLKRTVVYPAFAEAGPTQPVPGTKAIYLYLRLSKYHHDGADAIERQRIDLTRKLAAEGGWTIMGEYIDNDSASVSAQRARKGWHQLNNDIATGSVKAIAFWKLDRTNRVASRCIEWIGDCQRAGVYLVSHQDSAEELNTATAGAKMITGIKALIAEVETDAMSERQLAAKRHLAEAGLYNGGQPPFGWMAGPRVTDEHGRSGIRLVPHPVEHQALKDAVRMVLAGQGLAEIARYWMNTYDITTASGAPVYEATIYRSLTSPRMIGYRMHRVPEFQRGTRVELLDYVARSANGDPVIAQEPVCDEHSWIGVKAILDRARTSRTRLPWGAREWLLTGMLYCQCGARLYGHNKSRVRSDGVRVQKYAYRCLANSARRPGSCSDGCTLDASQAEAYVLDWLFARTSLVPTGTGPHGGTGPALARIKADLASALAERETLLAKQGESQYRGAMVTVLLELIRDVQQRIEALQRQLDELARQQHGVPHGTAIVEAWPTMSLAQKRSQLRRAIDHIDTLPGRNPVDQRMVIVAAGEFGRP